MARQLILILWALLALATVARSASTPAENAASRRDSRELHQEGGRQLAGFKADAGVKRLIELARTNYKTKSDIANYEVPETKGCSNVSKRLDQMYDQVPCFADLDLMGVDHSDAILELVQSDQNAKDAIEAFFACEGGLLSFKVLEIMGVMPAYEHLHTGPKAGN